MQSNLCDLLVNFGLLVPLQHAWANAVIICSGRGKRLLICWRGAKTYWLGVGKFPWEKTKDSFLVLAWMLFSVISRSAGCGFFFFFYGSMELYRFSMNNGSTNTRSLNSLTFVAVFSSRVAEGGSAAIVKLSGSSRSRIFDSFIRLSNFFFATFSTCFLFIEV